MQATADGADSRPGAAQRAAATASPWIENPVWDLLFVLNAIPIGLLVLARLPEGTRELFAVASLWLWGGHLFAPLFAGWSNHDFRRHMLAQRSRYVAWPLAGLFASVAIGALAGAGFTSFGQLETQRWNLLLRGPLDLANGFLFLAYAYTLWNAWHFAGQNFGLLTIYRLRVGRTDASERRFDRIFTLAQMLLFHLATLVNARFLLDHVKLLAILPDESALAPLRLGLAAGAGLLLLAAGLRELRSERPSPPRALYLLQVGLTSLVALRDPQTGLAMYAWSHWITAMALGARIVARQPHAFAGFAPARAAQGFAGAFLILLLVSWSSEDLLRIAEMAEERTAGFMQARFIGPSIGALIGLRFGCALLHFLYDRFLYRFSEPAVRASIAPALLAPPRGGLRWLN